MMSNSNSKPIKVLRYSSDIHLEMGDNVDQRDHVAALYTFEKKPNHRYFLAITGDIGSLDTPSLARFFSRITSHYEKIYFVAGNHEYYNQVSNGSVPIKTMSYIKNMLTQLCMQFPNIEFLDNKSVQLDEYRIIGSTLWSHVPDNSKHLISQSLNDYNLIFVDDNSSERGIRRLTVDDTNRYHQEALSFIQNEIKQHPYNCIVLTHHAPLYSDASKGHHLCSPKYLDSPINCAFHSDLNWLIHPPIVLWLYGHTHHTSKFIHNGVVICTNQVGYSHEGYGYQPYEQIILGSL